ncbi:MAG: DUF1501 domain-containing protein [Fuerstiella sp.]|nr:DUF1501 domain-containing protein [Fuerstiella sp.]
MTSKRPFCDGIIRRDFLRVGAAGAFGFGATLPGMLEQQALATGTQTSGPQGPPGDVSVIYIFLLGGLSTIDTLDMKPNAPAEVRGEFSQIQTNVPGIEVCEHLPHTAQHADKFSLVRSFAHGDSGHGSGDKYMLTGYLQQERPAFGSVAAHEFGSRGGIPPYVVMPSMHPSAGPSFLGSAAAPFLIDADPSAPGFAVPDLAPPLDIDASRLADRRSVLGTVDRFRRHVDSRGEAGAYNKFRERAFALMTSAEAKRAFDIQRESESVRQAYGINTMGQSCLLARRLVQSGVRYVMINHNNWDTHANNFGDLKDNLLPQLDKALGELLRDLSDRGMLEKTLVLVSGEFGRTPKVNENAGRDHWGNCFTLALAGGGIQGGRVVGSSDKWAAKPDQNPIGPKDFAATMFHVLGVDSEKLVYTMDNRPVKLLDEGRRIHELL